MPWARSHFPSPAFHILSDAYASEKKQNAPENVPENESFIFVAATYIENLPKPNFIMYAGHYMLHLI